MLLACGARCGATGATCSACFYCWGLFRFVAPLYHVRAFRFKRFFIAPIAILSSGRAVGLSPCVLAVPVGGVGCFLAGAGAKIRDI